MQNERVRHSLPCKLATLVMRFTGRSKAFQSSANNDIKHELATGHRLFRYFPDLDLHEKRVLDLGSGYGGKAVYYLKGNPKTIVGIEPCVHAVLEGLKSLNGNKEGLRFIVGYGEHMPFTDDSFDLILSDSALRIKKKL